MVTFSDRRQKAVNNNAHNLIGRRPFAASKNILYSEAYIYRLRGTCVLHLAASSRCPRSGDVIRSLTDDPRTATAAAINSPLRPLIRRPTNGSAGSREARLGMTSSAGRVRRAVVYKQLGLAWPCCHTSLLKGEPGCCARRFSDVS